MKVVSILCLIFASVNCFPAEVSDSGENSDERPLILVPAFANPGRPSKFNPSVVEVDVGADADSDEDAFFSSFFRPFFVNPFAGFKFGGFPDFFSRPTWFDNISPKVNPDAKVKNATSTVKVADGHKIVVNDTIYEDEKTGAVFRFHFVQVSPVDSKETGTEQENSSEVGNRVNTEEPTVNKNSSPEEDASNKNASPEEVSSKPDNNSADNEINREELGKRKEGEKSQENNSQVEVFDVLDQHEEEPQRYVDLSGDIKINQLMADQGQQLVMIPEDVELLPDYYLRSNENQQPIDLGFPTFDNEESKVPEVPDYQSSDYTSFRRFKN